MVCGSGMAVAAATARNSGITMNELPHDGVELLIGCLTERVSHIDPYPTNIVCSSGDMERRLIARGMITRATETQWILTEWSVPDDLVPFPDRNVNVRC